MKRNAQSHRWLKGWLPKALAAWVFSLGCLHAQADRLPGSFPTTQPPAFPSNQPVNALMPQPFQPMMSPPAVQPTVIQAGKNFTPNPTFSPPVTQTGGTLPQTLPQPPQNRTLPPALNPLPTTPGATPNQGPVGPAPNQIKEGKTTEAPPAPAIFPPPPVLAPPLEEPAPAAGCTTCGPKGHRHHGGGGGGCSSCGGGGCGSCITGGPGARCYPGKPNCCDFCDDSTCFGAVFCSFYSCICCPDPCYEPRWIPEANSAFWVDSARPWTQTRIRVDTGNFFQPDRGEFFWARADGGGKGPRGGAERRVRYVDASLTTEIAANKGSIMFEVPYRSVDPDVNDHGAGFGDMNIAAKAMLLDCEILQISTLFRTYLPVGNAFKGVGTGHVSLEPSLLVTMKLLPETYFQGQLSEWIPIGGDPAYSGAVLHSHSAINHVMCRLAPDVVLIGGAELNTYTFQDGAFTDPILGAFQQASGGTFLFVGPSLRLSICNKVDFGCSVQFNTSSEQWGPEQVYRSELRIRF